MNPIFDTAVQSLSARVLSHFETPLAPAFLRYPDFSCGVQRNSTRAVEGFLMGGLPLGRFVLSMPDIMTVQKRLDKGVGGLYLVRTLTEGQMTKHPLKIVGEVQMKKIQHDMTVLRRTNERLLSDRAKLVSLLRDANKFWREGTSANPAAIIGDTDEPLSHRARALLRELGESV